MARDFPEHLLDRSIDERVAFFKQKRLNHPKIEAVDQQLLSQIRMQAGTNILHVVGPSGVGKSVLIEGVMKKVLALAQKSMQENRGLIPIISLELPKIDAMPFNWKDFYLRLLLAALEPLVCSKISPTSLKEHMEKHGMTVPRTLSTTADLRYSVERCLVHRGVETVIVDEAHGFGRVASGRTTTDQMEAVKSLANMGRVLLVLVGPYELLSLADLNEQLCRRNSVMEFERYQPCKPELTEFQGVVYSFQQALPLKEEPDLLLHWEDYYERSCGCVGVLKDWLARALTEALAFDERTLTRRIVDHTAKPQRELKRMARAIADGESRMKDLRKGDAVSLRTLLGIPDVLEQEAEAPIGLPPAASKKPRVGVRAPARDPLGPLEPPADATLAG